MGLKTHKKKTSCTAFGPWPELRIVVILNLQLGSMSDGKLGLFWDKNWFIVLVDELRHRIYHRNFDS